ncbi:MAG TPA: hypothetical protein VF203_14915 [Burkholderiales bacterium]
MEIEFRGRYGEGLGIALWQADGSGPEPAAVGHRFVTPFETITAHYYIASRDHVDAAARGGLVCVGLRGEWSRTRSALAAQGRAPADLVLRVPLTTPGADREGEDWHYRDGIETRYLRPVAPLPLLCGGAVVLEFAPARLVLTEDYRGARSFADVRIALVSDATEAQAPDSRASAATRALTDALLADLAGRRVRFVVDAVRLTPHAFGGAGRTSGRYAEIPSARLEVLRTGSGARRSDARPGQVLPESSARAGASRSSRCCSAQSRA